MPEPSSWVRRICFLRDSKTDLMSIDLFKYCLWAGIDPYVPFLVHACYRIPWKQRLLFQRGCLAFILLTLTTSYLLNTNPALFRLEHGVDVGWWLMESYYMQHHFPLPPSFLPVCPSLSARGRLQWILQLLLSHNINTGIDALLLFSGVCLCVVQCIEMRGWWGFRGWLTSKEELHSPFPFALIRMSTVKPPPKSRLGKENKRGWVKEAFLSCQTDTKFWPLHWSKRSFNSVFVGRGLSRLVQTGIYIGSCQEYKECVVKKKKIFYYSQVLTEGHVFREPSVKSFISPQSSICSVHIISETAQVGWSHLSCFWINKTRLRKRRYKGR